MEFIGLSYSAKQKGNSLEFNKLSKSDNVIFLDFVPNNKDLMDLIEYEIPHLIIDHHKTAIEELDFLEKENGVTFNSFLSRDNSRSGVGLVADYFAEFTGDEAPGLWWFFRHAQDRDLWAWELSNTEAMCEAIGSYEYDFSIWDELLLGVDNKSILYEAYARLLAEGKAILRNKNKSIDMIKNSAYTMEVGPYTAKVLNSNVFMSELGNKLSSEDGIDFAIIYTIDKDEKARCSLRSQADFDCSKIAKFFGGGGHSQACGCLVGQVKDFKNYAE